MGPDFLLAEIGNILWKKVRFGDLQEKEARRIARAARAAPIALHATAPLFEHALILAVGLQRAFYDSLYLTLAATEGCVLVTADLKFYNAVRRDAALSDYVRWVEDAT